MSTPRTPERVSSSSNSNGVLNGSPTGKTTSHAPRTPSLSSFALTEYATNGSAVPSTPIAKRQTGIPDAFLLPNGYPDYLRLILTSRVYEVVEETPLTHALNLSNRLECRVLLKREDLQPVFSFKLRGAYNRMAHLTEDQRWRGVIACSAGNHAQGVAYSARKLKIPATIVMPSGTPDIKHKNVSRLGGSVLLRGADFDAAKEEAVRLQQQHSLVNIPPFDDPYVIAGQGTIGMELLRQTNLTELEAVFCCVGGGGLIAGVGVYIKRIAPHVKVIGVETYDANAMVLSLEAGKRVALSDVGLFADGAAVKNVGEETFRICKEVVDEIIQVTTDELCAAIKDVFEDTRSILEPAGALSLAGLKKYASAHPTPDSNRALVAVASGANMNFDRLRFVAERAALGEKKEALLAVRIPERPGAFAALIDTIAPASVTEFCYRYLTPDAAHVILGVAVTMQELPSLISRLEAQDMPVKDLSDDELAKTHIRYLVGGRASIDDELLYSFEFPERQGALVRFLTTLQPGFNISLFHYRNYGGDVAKVLAGIQVPEGQEREIEAFLKKVGYPYKEETQNEVYRMFMRV
ncbi:MAG: hypothetical protein M1828_003147 [Chrysothrix sp. TS-e1954]|nr:MAG: hypothetical protein M1828_003147 [Chrysothrix sp. TS-e1954]